MSEGAVERAEAARILEAVVDGRRTTDQVMAGATVSPLTQELVLGSLRHYFSLTFAVEQALHRPVKAQDRVVKFLMIVGAYQLWFLRIPDHAALNETVSACAELGRPWARGLVNAVLRQCARGGRPAARSFEHPEWLIRAIRQDYADAEAVMAANNERAPMALRINLARTTPTAYVAQLDAANIGSRATGACEQGEGIGLGPETRILESPRRMDTLPGYAEGLVSVQDAGAQFAAPLLAPQPGERVLDACAAPGGKLFHLAERCPGVHLTALDNHPERLDRLQREAQRLGHRQITAVPGDAAGLAWWDGRAFDRVLLDAPCSGTGTLRRHPDIKVLRQPEDIAPMAALQERLLSALWRALEPGGTLLYCTCSILSAENDEVISRFLAHQGDARVSPFQLRTGRATRHGWQLLPTDTDTDGFYYARMIKLIKGNG